VGANAEPGAYKFTIFLGKDDKGPSLDPIIIIEDNN
jgi:hypothetical protein